MITEQILSIIEMEFGNSNEIHVFGACLLLWTQLGLARVFFFVWNSFKLAVACWRMGYIPGICLEYPSRTLLRWGSIFYQSIQEVLSSNSEPIAIKFFRSKWLFAWKKTCLSVPITVSITHESIDDWIHEMYIFLRNFRPMQLNCIIWAIVRVCNTQSGEQYTSGVYARQMYMTQVSFV